MGAKIIVYFHKKADISALIFFFFLEFPQKRQFLGLDHMLSTGVTKKQRLWFACFELVPEILQNNLKKLFLEYVGFNRFKVICMKVARVGEIADT